MLIVLSSFSALISFLPSRQISNPSSVATASALLTLAAMANDVDEVTDGVEAKPKTVELEGRGTVPCHIW